MGMISDHHVAPVNSAASHAEPAFGGSAEKDETARPRESSPDDEDNVYLKMKALNSSRVAAVVQDAAADIRPTSTSRVDSSTTKAIDLGLSGTSASSVSEQKTLPKPGG